MSETNTTTKATTSNTRRRLISKEKRKEYNDRFRENRNVYQERKHEILFNNMVKYNLCALEMNIETINNVSISTKQLNHTLKMIIKQMKKLSKLADYTDERKKFDDIVLDNSSKWVINEQTKDLLTIIRAIPDYLEPVP